MPVSICRFYFVAVSPPCAALCLGSLRKTGGFPREWINASTIERCAVPRAPVLLTISGLRLVSRFLIESETARLEFSGCSVVEIVFGQSPSPERITAPLVLGLLA